MDQATTHNSLKCAAKTFHKNSAFVVHSISLKILLKYVTQHYDTYLTLTIR